MIFVLWAVVILGFVAASFSGNTRNAIKLEKVTVDRMKNLYVARGAAVYAMGKVQGVSDDDEDDDDDDDDDYDDNDEFEEEGDEFEEEDEDEDDDDSVNDAASESTGGIKGEAEKQKPWLPRLKPYTVFVGDRECRVYIEDESGKININAIGDKTRKLLVEYLIGQKFKNVEAGTITDSVLDWKDKDDLKHLNGAETEYYESLEEPYEAKNADFDSVEELTLIRGMTPAKFDRIRRDITIYGGSLAININFASREVLMAIPRISPEGADYIIAQRNRKGSFKSMEDVRKSFWHLGIVGASFEDIRPYITIDNSGFTTIRATCEAKGVSSTYRAVISKVSNKVEVFAVYPD